MAHTLSLSLSISTALQASPRLSGTCGVRAVALGKLGAVLPAAEAAGVKRVVLLSTAGEPSALIVGHDALPRI
jgi:hypothetical protein